MCTWLTVVFAGASILRCGIELYVYLINGSICRSFDTKKVWDRIICVPD